MQNARFFDSISKGGVCMSGVGVCVSLFVLVFYNQRAVLSPKWVITNRYEVKAVQIGLF